MLEELMGQISQTQVEMRYLLYLQKTNFLKLAWEDGMWKIFLAWSYILRFPISHFPQASLERGAAGSSARQKQGQCPELPFHVVSRRSSVFKIIKVHQCMCGIQHGCEPCGHRGAHASATGVPWGRRARTAVVWKFYIYLATDWLSGVIDR